MNTLELRISNTLRDFGVTADLSGYSYLKYAIELAVPDTEHATIGIMDLYDSVAKKYNTTVHRVERACRYALHEGWPYSVPEIVQSLFGSNPRIPPKGKFIKVVSDYLRMRTRGSRHGS